MLFLLAAGQKASGERGSVAKVGKRACDGPVAIAETRSETYTMKPVGEEEAILSRSLKIGDDSPIPLSVSPNAGRVRPFSGDGSPNRRGRSPNPGAGRPNTGDASPISEAVSPNAKHGSPNPKTGCPNPGDDRPLPASDWPLVAHGCGTPGDARRSSGVLRERSTDALQTLRAGRV